MPSKLYVFLFHLVYDLIFCPISELQFSNFSQTYLLKLAEMPNALTIKLILNHSERTSLLRIYQCQQVPPRRLTYAQKYRSRLFQHISLKEI